MNSRERFRETMRFGDTDRSPYFEEGIRAEVLRQWRRQGHHPDKELGSLMAVDARHEIQPELGPLPRPKRWPSSRSELQDFRRQLNPEDRARLPGGWLKEAERAKRAGATIMLRAHRGFFLSMGVEGWDRLCEVVYLLRDDPTVVHEAMALHAELATAVARRVLDRVEVDAVIFSEPIGGNDRPLLSPTMYEDFVLSSYEPLLDLIRAKGVETVILRTYANARVLLPSLLARGFNCLWACEVDAQAMDYRDLRREFGKDLCLIGGIDLDVLRLGDEAIRRELMEKVPPLLADGGYVPLADGRVREDVPFESYLCYRELLQNLLTD